MDSQTAEAQRERVLRATIDVVALRGYTDAAAVHIVREAGVSSRDFYRDFADKGECFLVALEQALDELISVAIDAFDECDTWSGGIQAAVRAVLDALAEDPAIANICFLDVLAAGHDAWERRAARIDRLVAHLCPDDRLSPSPDEPQLVAHTTIGGFSYVVQREAAARTASRLPLLSEDLAYLVMLPFIGPQKAAAAVEGWRLANPGAA